MSELQIFGRNGEFILPDQAALDSLPAEQRGRFRAVEIAYHATKDAEKNLDAAVTDVAHAVETSDAAEKYLARNFKALTFHDLWKQSTTFAQQTRGR